MEPYFLYILRSQVYSRHYIGIASDPDARLENHNKGKVRSTKAYRPWRIVHIEKYKNRSEATRRELFLKNTAAARTQLFDKLNNKNNGPIV